MTSSERCIQDALCAGRPAAGCGRTAGSLLLHALFVIAGCCWLSRAVYAQEPEAVCGHGEGRYEARLPSGISVLVAAAKSWGFAARSCGATIRWKDQPGLEVPGAAQVDIDVMGADIGLGTPVVAFQTRKTDLDWLATYEIYSADKAPRLLRTITGGDFYRAVDVNLDGRIAIWTSDAAAAIGFDDMAYRDFDFAPTVVLRFEHKRLIDVSAEYPTPYDQEIAGIRKGWDPAALAAFRGSDGKLLDGSLPADRLLALRKVKAKVLEVVCAFLYSGRDQEGWKELASDWPPGDADRVEKAILAARKKGIDAEVEAIAGPASRFRKGHAVVYDTSGTIPHGKPRGLTTAITDNTAISLTPINSLVDSAPQPIVMQRQNLAKSAETLELTIDAAGKVWSARLKGAGDDPELLQAAKQWKFIPAYRGGRPVACHDLIEVSPEQ